MPTPEEIASEQEKLYESASLRDDLNDAEGEVLLKWGETQVAQLAKTFPEDFEQKARFFRQLLKNMNRFVGQREFNDEKGQREYLEKVVKYLEPLGYQATEKDLFAALPDDAKDMMATLKSMIKTLTPDLGKSSTPENPTPTPAEPETKVESDTQTQLSSTDEQEIPAITDTLEAQTPTFRPNIDKTEVIPDISHLISDLDDESANHNIFTTEKMAQLDLPTTETKQVDADEIGETLEIPNVHGINQPNNEAGSTGEESEDGTTDE